MVNNFEKIPERYIISIADGGMIGWDPLGFLYSSLTKQYDFTLGGQYFKEKRDDSLEYKLCKGIGFALGIGLNIISNGFPQAAALFIDAGKILEYYSDKKRKRGNNPSDYTKTFNNY